MLCRPNCTEWSHQASAQVSSSSSRQKDQTARLRLKLLLHQRLPCHTGLGERQADAAAVQAAAAVEAAALGARRRMLLRLHDLQRLQLL